MVRKHIQQIETFATSTTTTKIDEARQTHLNQLTTTNGTETQIKAHTHTHEQLTTSATWPPEPRTAQNESPETLCLLNQETQ